MGVSFNDPERNRSWAEAEKYGFELWTDRDRTLALAYGASSSRSALAPSRITVLLDAEGDLVQRWDKVDVGTHPEEVLDAARARFGVAPAP